MLLLIAQGIITSGIFWACWRILRRVVVKTDLDNVPGPASHSFLKGECRFVLSYLRWLTVFVYRKFFESVQHQCMGLSQGAWAEVYANSSSNVGLKAHSSPIRRRGGSDRCLPGCMFIRCIGYDIPLIFPQEKRLYVSDPKALHHIVVKVNETRNIFKSCR
jgi:hypothetical protein